MLLPFEQNLCTLTNTVSLHYMIGFIVFYNICNIPPQLTPPMEVSKKSNYIFKQFFSSLK